MNNIKKFYQINFLSKKSLPIIYRNKTSLKTLQQKIIELTRVTKVTSGFKKLTIRVVSACGNRRGIVGLGLGRALVQNDAVLKSFKNCEKNLIKIPLTKNFSIPYYSEAKVISSHIKLYPKSNTNGLIIGGSARAIVEVAGIRNIVAIQHNSTNTLNSARATILALNNINYYIGLLSARLLDKKKIFNKNLLNYPRVIISNNI